MATTTPNTNNLTAIIITGYEEMVIEEVLESTFSFILPFTKNWKQEFFKKLIHFYIQNELEDGDYEQPITLDSLKSDKDLFLSLLSNAYYQIVEGAYLVQSEAKGNEIQEDLISKNFYTDIPGKEKDFDLELIEIFKEYNVSIEDVKQWDEENGSSFEFLHSYKF